MPEPNHPPEFSVVVPNWNGEAYLRRGIGSLLLSARRAGKPFEIVVVDDASDDGGADLVETEFPSVILVRRENNGGFAETVNQGVNAAQGRFVILANNDLIVREEFIPFLLEAIQPDDVFAVSAKTVDWDKGAPNHVEMSAVWREGLLAETHNDPTELCESVYAQGGACPIRRADFLAMGGFCDLYFAGYWEVYDLSYWARKIGMRVLYQPRAIANHLGKASLAARYGKDRLEILRRRNQILFTWLNLTDCSLWFRHLLSFPAAIALDLARQGNSPLAKGFLRAIAKIPAVLSARRKRVGTRRIPDRGILR